MHVSIPADTPIIWNVPGLHYNGRSIISVNGLQGLIRISYREVLGGTVPIQTRKVRQRGLQQGRLHPIFCWSESLYW